MRWYHVPTEHSTEYLWDEVAAEDELLIQDMLDYEPDTVKLQSWFRASSIKHRERSSESFAGHRKRVQEHECRVERMLAELSGNYGKNILTSY